jgi:branched-chain amino acid aminotransferase
MTEMTQTEEQKALNIDWKNLGFSYIKTDYRFISYWKDGKWDDGEMTTDNKVHISEGSPVLHYGQSCFEGMKAYRTKDGSINLFRPEENAKRMINSCQRLLMPEFPVEKFVEAAKAVVKANEKWVPPYNTGSTLYLRPYLMGVGDNIGVSPATEYIFSIFAMPVGPYFKGGLTPTNFIVSDYDKIEEVGSANFFGITKDNRFVTPKSPSILPSITKYSLLYLAEHHLGMQVEEGDVYIDKLDEFSEAGACGTAAVISPIGGIQHGDNFHVFYSETEVGPVTRKLYEELTGIQFGDIEAPEGWIVKVD